MTDQRAEREARELDVVLLGATGFTGRLVAEYLADKRPGIRWALAGRNREKLERVRDELARRDPALEKLPLITADTAARADMDALARRTRVICTTVGPYTKLGSAVVAACAEHGTDYCDLNGEPLWMREMIDAHHARAEQTGARIVFTCGFDSIPSDLGVLLAHEHLRRHGHQIARARLRTIKFRGGASGGSVASGFATAEQLSDPAKRQAMRDPYLLNPEGERHGPDGPDAMAPQLDEDTRRWAAPFVMSFINTRVVRRTNALLDYPYGRQFRYDEAMDAGPGPLGLLRASAVAAAMAASQGVVAVTPLRNLVRRLLPAPGEGPSAEQRERGRFLLEIRAVATDGERVRVEVGADRDPGYGATAWMLGESALCLAEDELPARGGMLTPASCMGLKLVERLRAAGMTFRVAE